MKNHILIVTLMGVLALIFNACEKELTTHDELALEELSLQTLEQKGNYELIVTEAKQVPQVVKRIEKYDNDQALKWSKDEPSNSAYWINPNQVLSAVDSLGNQTYSFELKSKEYEPKHLYNLIVSNRVDDKKIHPFIVDYEFTDSNKYDYAQDQQRQFKGKINIYSYQNFINSVGNLTARDTISATPCYENMVRVNSSDSESDGGGSSGGDGGTGGGIGSGTTGGSFSWAPLPTPSTTVITIVQTKTPSVEVGIGYYINYLTEDFKGDSTTESSTTTVNDSNCPEDVALLLPINEEEEYIINKLEGKVLCVYEKLLKDDDNYNWITENFIDENDNPSAFDLIFEMSDDLSDNTNGITKFSSHSNISNTFIIKINRHRSENKNTSLINARTLIHESIHARLLEFVYRNDRVLSDIENSFPGVYDFYRRFEKNWSHQQMAAFYRSTIVQGLKYFDNNNHTDEYYNAIAWEGLAEIKDLNGNNEIIYTEAWKEVPDEEKKEILQIITYEKNNGTKDCF